MLLESCLWLTSEILAEWVIFADITLAICIYLAMSYVTCLWHWLVSALAAIHQWWSFLPIFCLFTFDMVWLMGGAVKLLIVWGVTAPWEIMLCSWMFWFAESHCHDGLAISNSHHQIPYSMISSFGVAPCGFYSRAYSKSIFYRCHN
jgi:hypothetical protein